MWIPRFSSASITFAAAAALFTCIICAVNVDAVPVGFEQFSGSITRRLLKEGTYYGTKAAHKKLSKNAHSQLSDEIQSTSFDSAQLTNSRRPGHAHNEEPIAASIDDCFINDPFDEGSLSRSFKECLELLSTARSASTSTPRFGLTPSTSTGDFGAVERKYRPSEGSMLLSTTGLAFPRSPSFKQLAPALGTSPPPPSLTSFPRFSRPPSLSGSSSTNSLYSMGVPFMRGISSDSLASMDDRE